MSAAQNDWTQSRASHFLHFPNALAHRRIRTPGGIRQILIEGQILVLLPYRARPHRQMIDVVPQPERRNHRPRHPLL
jgi:hypothetical protein